MKLDLIIRGGRIVNADGVKRADVGVRGEKIVELGDLSRCKDSPDAETIDARGLYVIPGGVDAHVHLDLPVGNTVTADDYDSGTRAAACGGVTTVIDFATPAPGESLQQAVEAWMARADGKAYVDYSFHAAVTDWPRQKKEIKRLIDFGVPTFKQYMIYAEQGLQSDDADLFDALETLRDLGGLLCVHAESSRVLDLLIQRHHKPALMKKYGARLHALTRPNFIEAEAVERAVHWAKVTRGPLFIVHLSTAEAADIVARAQQHGVNVRAETCAQYLTFDDSVFDRPDAHLYATSPQVKKPRDQRRLWQALKRGEITSVSTDTCSFTRRQKDAWRGDWTKIPMGLPGLETLLPLVYTLGVLKRRLTLPQFVEKCSTAPAKIMGLYPRKGVIRTGADADLALIHPARKRKVDWRKMQSNCDWSPYQNMLLAGFPLHVLSRGRRIVQNQKLTPLPPAGQFIPRRLK